MTQVGQRPIQKVQKWVEPSEVEVRLQKTMESRGMNHDRNPLPINATTMANAINDLVKSNLPSRVKIREPDPFNSSNPKKLRTFLLQCKLNF